MVNDDSDAIEFSWRWPKTSNEILSHMLPRMRGIGERSRPAFFQFNDFARWQASQVAMNCSTTEICVGHQKFFETSSMVLFLPGWPASERLRFTRIRCWRVMWTFDTTTNALPFCDPKSPWTFLEMYVGV